MHPTASNSTPEGPYPTQPANHLHSLCRDWDRVIDDEVRKGQIEREIMEALVAIDHKCKFIFRVRENSVWVADRNPEDKKITLMGIREKADRILAAFQEKMKKRKSN